jgi:glycosyltransferase involved in cell wall biosynthesis
MKASIIITTYNRSAVLKVRSLPSAINQNFDDFEVLVIDDCSNDDTEIVVKKIKEGKDNVKFIRQEKNSGLAAARNRGAREAKGEYVVFLDDDDALHENFLKTTVPLLRALPENFGGVSGARMVVYDEKTKEYALPSLEGTFYTTIDDGWLLRKKVFDVIQYDEELLTDEDADFGIQFFKMFKARIIDEVLLFKYSHPIGIRKKSEFFSFSFPSERRFIGLDRFLKKNLHVFEESKNKKELAFIYRFAGRNYCWGGRMKKGTPYLKKAFMTDKSIRNLCNLLAACCGATAYRWYWALESFTVRTVRSKILNKA